MFGIYLVENEIVTKEQLQECINLQRFKKEKIGRLLVELGYLTQKKLDQSLVKFLRPECPLKVSELIKLKKAVALTESEKNLTDSIDCEIIQKDDEQIILIDTTFSDLKIKKAEGFFGKKITLWITTEEISSIISSGNKKTTKRSGNLVVNQSLSDEEKLEEDNPYARLIKESIDDAIVKGASDIHYEPFNENYIIRLRIHGGLSDWKIIEAKHSEAITNKLKSIINMDLATIGRPQDSPALFAKRKIAIRANSFPVVSGGEKIVLRLQKQDQEFILEDLGLSETSYDVITRAITKRDGLILISGPTGSGKTTTLYSLLCKMDKFGKNISTLENPVEKRLPRINQGNLSDYGSFTEFQRALMRQDPDIILVGEVRDKESAELCMKLSATGHLVLSTIHANGAKEVVERLRTLGVDDFLIKSNLRLSVAQRLLKKICPKCSIPAPDDLVKKLIGINKVESESPFKISTPKGCDNCHAGVISRIAVIEYLEKDEIKKSLLDPEFTSSSSLTSESLSLAAKGLIDINEVFQIA
jgi:type IV pilus assembly protein PilB